MQSSRDRGIDQEVFAFIVKLLPAVDVVNFLVVVGLSTRPWLSLAIGLCIPIVGVGGVKLAERLNKNLAKPQMAAIVALHFLICSVSGPQSPAWLFCIAGLVASVFLVAEMRFKIVFLVAILMAAGLGNYVSGKDHITIIAVTVALGCFSVLLIRTYQFLRKINTRLEKQKIEIGLERSKSDKLLLNILPVDVVAELSATGIVKPTRYESTTVLFTDFVGFTQAASTMPADRMVSELNEVFAAFDAICDQEGVEKIKTIGDAYMAAAGLPTQCPDHAYRCVRAGLSMLMFVEQRNTDTAFKWALRVGIHSGPVVAGVVGRRKYAYDIWSDTVNIASRMESSGEAGRVNLSAYTYDLIRKQFDCEYRGKVVAKGKGEVDMYFVTGAKDLRQK